MADEQAHMVRRMELTKELLEDLGITKALKEKLSNLPAQAADLIKEYGAYYKQMFEQIH